MNNLTQVIETAIEQALDAYMDRITEEWDNVDRDRLASLWESKTKSKKKSSRKASTTNSEGCPYRYIKGKRKDENCGVKPKDGNTYCATHKKYEGQEQKERKVLPDSKRTIRPKTKKSPPAKKTTLVLRKNRALDKLWNSETELVFRSAKERIVIGKADGKKLLKLTAEDIDKCKERGFKFDKTQVEGYEASDSDSEPEDEESKPSKHVYLVADGKFWEGTVTDSEYTVKYGKIGSAGRTTTKDMDTYDKAVKELEKVQKQKIKKGYSLSNKDSAVDDKGSDSEDEAPAPKKKVSKRVSKKHKPSPKKKPVESDSDSDSEDEAPAPKKKASKKASKASKKASKVSSESEDEELEEMLNDLQDSDDESLDEAALVSKALGVDDDASSEDDLDEELLSETDSD
jgi:predicted DNA-binding WGR domain protein